MKRLIKAALDTNALEMMVSEIIESVTGQTFTMEVETQRNGNIYMGAEMDLPITEEQAQALSDTDYSKDFSRILARWGLLLTVQFDYAQEDENAGYFAILAQNGSTALCEIAYDSAKDAKVTINGTTLHYSVSNTFPDIENVQKYMGISYQAQMGDILSDPNIDRNYAPVSFQDMDEQEFNSLLQQGYFKGQPTYQEIQHCMQVFERAVDYAVSLTGNTFEKPPLAWGYHGQGLAFAVGLMGDGASGIAVSSQGELWKKSDKDIFSVALHEFAHEIDAQGDLLSLEQNAEGTIQGDQRLLQYLTNGKVEHNFDGWDGLYDEHQKDIAKLAESWADLFSTWVMHYVFGDTIKKTDEEVMRYLDYLFGYMDWAQNGKTVEEAPEEGESAEHTTRRTLEQLYTPLSEWFTNIGLPVAISYNKDGTVIVSADERETLTKFKMQFSHTFEEYVRQYLPDAKFKYEMKPGEFIMKPGEYQTV